MGRLKTAPSKLGAMPSSGLSKVNSNSWRPKGGGATARGYTYQWEQYRKRFLLLNPLCVYCQRVGKVTEACIVDHIIPHQGNQTLFWQQDNHQALCKLCHDSVKAREEARLGYR